MIDLILIVVAVMFGTLLYDKNKKRNLSGQIYLKEGFNGLYGDTYMPDSEYTPSYGGFIQNYKQDFGKADFSPYKLSANMETYQPIDYDNNIASIYGYKPDGYDTTPRTTVLTCTENDGLMGMNRWCGCEALSSNGTTETAIRRLIGGVNPRTLIAPKLIPPITDMEEWGTDNYTIHSATNNYRSDELFLSGYVTLDNCKCRGVCNCSRRWNNDGALAPSSDISSSRRWNKPLIKENFYEDVLGSAQPSTPAHWPTNATNISGTLGPLTTRVNSSCRGTLLGGCGGEDLSQGQVVADHNFLSPYDVSEQRITRPQILQNYGVSRVPEKSVYTGITDGEDLMFIEQKRKHGGGPPYSTDYITGDEPSMVYDPRRVGYSDSKRAYVDKLLGQPKFYYDDINAARAPNYITRNKIDIYSFGESTGRLKDPKNLSETCGDNNQLAVEEFHNSALQHRADMMQSFMNKRNGEMWQLREFPISTNGQRMSGGTSKI